MPKGPEVGGWGVGFPKKFQGGSAFSASEKNVSLRGDGGGGGQRQKNLPSAAEKTKFCHLQRKNLALGGACSTDIFRLGEGMVFRLGWGYPPTPSPMGMFVLE